VLPALEGATDVDIESLLVIVEPTKKVDAQKYLIENIYDRQLSKRAFWNVGLTRNRNEDVKFVNRYVAFGGLVRVSRKRGWQSIASSVSSRTPRPAGFQRCLGGR
jgi:hypothetical protein